MPDFKLISADSHVNEPPAAWERVQKKYGDKAPKVVKDPAGVPKGTWLLIDGLPPVGLSHYSKGLVADKFHYAKLGFRGVQIPTRIKDSGYYEAKYEPLWQALEETGVIVNVHTSVTQGVARTHYEGPREEDPVKEPIGLARKQVPAQQFIGNMILSGNFDRHPKLRVVCAEFDVGWVANLVQQVDYWFGRASTYDADRNLNKRPPSEYFKTNIFFTYP